MARTNNSNYAFPAWMYVPAGIALLLVLGPLVGLIVKIPWSRAGHLLTEPSAMEALELSVTTACVSTVCCVVVGIPLSLMLTRTGRPRTNESGRIGTAGLASAFSGPIAFIVYAPLVLSPVVSGLALMFFWGRNGLFGKILAEADVTIAFTSWAVILAQVFVSMPFFVSTAVTALSAIPRRYEEIAATEGATRGEIIRKVLLPQAGPGLLTAGLLSFARALGEFGATITFAGNIEGTTRTIPLNIEIGLSSNDVDAALGSCIMLLALYLLVVGLMLLARFLGKVRKAGNSYA
ncbi:MULTISPECIES: molybdate ABC transporter permease subunit [Micrococcaceae]|uniref:molybdate ABC transporter permease subunit n=1 Tax=unclassified Kocuria TaxID=2649579 RepID=UPI001EE1484B|nr:MULTISPECIES: ABC transporter permease subunit [unclassified Kocuria]